MSLTTKETLFRVIDLFDSLSVKWWLDGGWGVDVLYGSQTRDHRDIDINFDAAETDQVLAKLKDAGYIVETDWLPVRAELVSPALGYLDIHPFVIEGDIVKQANPEGSFWEFPEECFGTVVFEGRTIPCISLEGQKLFHSGYEPREQDLHDVALLKEIESRQY